MAKVIVSLKHRPEEYDVLVKIYGDKGELVKSEEYSGVKQVIIKAKEVRLSRQLAPEPFVLVVEADKPMVEVRDKVLLFVRDERGSNE